MVEARGKQPKRSYLGASRWGEKCERRLGYEWHKAVEDEGAGFDAATYRIFDMGHDGESRLIEYLRLAGFTLHTEKPDGSQYGFYVCDGKLGGHIDGVVTAGPGGLNYPLLWENKALNDRSWKDTVNKGVKESKPTYYAQMQIYCAYLDIPNGGLFTAINRNTGEIHYEHVPFDARAAQEASDKALRVISSANADELPRCTNDPSNFICKWCPFKGTCWGKQTAKPAAPSPFWLQANPAAAINPNH